MRSNTISKDISFRSCSSLDFNILLVPIVGPEDMDADRDDLSHAAPLEENSSESQEEDEDRAAPRRRNRPRPRGGLTGLRAGHMGSETDPHDGEDYDEDEGDLEEANFITNQLQMVRLISLYVCA